MSRPNVLLLVMDTTRADHLSCYGYDRNTTPNIDAFASEGTRFENGIAPAGWTLPSHVSLFSGLLPSEHGVLHGEFEPDRSIPLLPELLSDAGYDTIGLSNNPWVSPAYALDQGFDEFHEIFREHVYKYMSGLKANIKRLRKLLLIEDTGADSTHETLKQWLQSRDDENPFFAFINYMEPHQVYTPPRPYHNEYVDGGPLAPYREVVRNRQFQRDRGKIFSGERPLTEAEMNARRDLYDSELAYLDDRMGSLFEWLDTEGVLDETLVLIVGDHGEAFGEHVPHGQLVDHHFSLYDPVTRVPMIARLPGTFDADTVTTPAQLTDIVPTVAELADADAGLSPDGITSESLCDLPDDRVALSEYLTPPPQLESLNEHDPGFDWDQYDVDLRMARSETHKLIHERNFAREELYDLRDDPAEQTDLSDQTEPPAALVERLADWADSDQVVPAARVDGERDDDVKDHLADLGYL